MDFGTRVLQPDKLLSDVFVYWLVNQGKHRLQTVFASVERAGEAPVCAEATDREDG